MITHNLQLYSYKTCKQIYESKQNLHFFEITDFQSFL